MKEGRTLSELAAELDRQRHEKRDFIADTRAIGMELDPDARPVLSLDGQHDMFGIRQTAHRQIGARLNIPAAYYDRMLTTAPALLAGNVNHWLKSTPEKRMVRTLDGHTRAFLSDRYRPLDNYDLAEAVLPALINTGVKVESCEVTETKMYLKAVAFDIRQEIRPYSDQAKALKDSGDFVCAGIVVSNSETGHGSVQVQPMLYRLACANGMIVPDASMRKYHIGGNGSNGNGNGHGIEEFFKDDTRAAIDKAFFGQVRDTVTGVLAQESFSRFVSKCEESTGIKLTGAPDKAVEEVAKRLTLTEEEKGGVLRHLIQGGDLTGWGLVNAITRTAQDVSSYDRATELEAAGFRVLELPAQDWKVIAQVN